VARPRFALAKQTADELLIKAGVRGPAVDVAWMATAVCGAELRAVPFDGDMDGVLIREPGKQPIIGVNDVGSKTEQRKRFTIAHEIGHLLLHSSPYHVDTKIHMRDAVSSLAESVEEIEANVFGSNLLMPDWMLKTSVAERAGMDMEELASDLAGAYNVSLQSMTLRLAKYLKYNL
jgi:Zn-dependent peptidase ImmA (M78 family)